MDAYIVEDELMAQKALAKTLTENFPDIRIVGTSTSVRETVEWLSDKSHNADVIFMDVELSDGNCFEIFKQTSINSKVIMTTAYDSYAVKAFEVNSIDYLLKPIDIQALQRAVARCRIQIAPINVERLLSAINKPSPKYKESFLVYLNDRIVPIQTSDIAYFYSEDKDNHVVTKDGMSFIIDASMDSLSCQLDTSVFFRISRGCIIAKSCISSVTKLFGGRLRVESKFIGKPHTKQIGISGSIGDTFTVSRSRTDDFLLWLEK